MNTIIYKKKNPLIKNILAVVLILFGFLLFLDNLFWSLLFMVIGVGLLSVSGSEIDLENKRYRTILSCFGINFGKWKPLPNLSYVSVFKTIESRKITAVTASTSFGTEIYEINAFEHNNFCTNFYKTYDISDAFKVAEHLRMALDLKILDATSTPSKWI